MKTITQAVSSLSFLLIVVFGLMAYGFASGQWTTPPSNPPNANVAAPINVGSQPQVKTGNIGAQRFVANEAVWSDQYCDGSGENCSGGGIGVNQTWRNLLPQRACGTTYNNTTGQPIMLSIMGRGHGTGFSMDIGATTNMIVSGGYSGNTNQSFQMIIPVDSTYRLNCAGIFEIHHWYELR